MIMKKIIYLILALLSFSLHSQDIDISLNLQQVQTRTFASFLTEKYDEVVPVINLQEENHDFRFFKPGKGWLSYKNEFAEIRNNLVIGFTGYSKKNNDHKFVYYGNSTTINIDNKLCLQSNWWNAHFDGDPKYINDPIIDSWSHKENMVNNLSAKIHYLGKYGSTSIGRGKMQIGNNIGGSIILNDACNDYGYFSGKLDLGNFEISLFHSTLIPDSMNTEGIFDDKHIVLHQFDWKSKFDVHLFFGESVVYGNRNIDPSYLLPHAFYRIIEHNLRDRDNVLVYGGLNFTPNNGKRWILYGNLILDELNVREIFGNWWGNKYALQTGVSTTWNSRLRTVAEFTAVRPWMYTHKFLVNKYSHDKISLGFPEGSNLIQFAFEFNFNIMRNLSVDVFSSYTKQGSLYNSFTQNYLEVGNSNNATADWLEGDVTTTVKLLPVVTYKFLRLHEIKLGSELINLNEEFTDPSFFINYQFTYKPMNMNEVNSN